LLDQVAVPLLHARVALTLQPADAIVVTLRLRLEAAGGASLVIALRLLLGGHRAGCDKPGQHQNDD